ncbi:MAG: zinc-ribbon domain-containing protein [Myxococcota bacterium]
MLISCPECGRKVSDRAKACPDCGFPVAEWVSEQTAAKAAEVARATRKDIGEVDCPYCDARGFRMVEMEGGGQGFAWCAECEQTGRVRLFEAQDGFYAVSPTKVDEFQAGKGEEVRGIKFLGTERPEGFRYAQAGPRHSETEIRAAEEAIVANLGKGDEEADGAVTEGD